MGFFRFRRSFKIAPGLRLNVSKTGVSTSIGGRGATLNVRGDRVRGTVGLPGTGINYSEQQRTNSAGSIILFVLLAAALLFALL